MNTKVLNKQIEASIATIDNARAIIEDAETELVQSVQRDPSALYFSMLLCAVIGYNLRNRISTLQAVQISAKLL